MKYTRFEDHEGPDGKLNWKSYHDSQKRNGEVCSRCGKYILFPKGYPEQCPDCHSLSKSKQEVYHSSLVRCPKCLTEIDAFDLCSYGIHEEGEHEVSCPGCDANFVVNTTISYKFESPAIEEKPEEQESSEEQENQIDS
jgi:hypothetical protein